MAKAKKLASGSWRVQVFSHYETVNGALLERYISIKVVNSNIASL